MGLGYLKNCWPEAHPQNCSALTLEAPTIYFGSPVKYQPACRALVSLDPALWTDIRRPA